MKEKAKEEEEKWCVVWRKNGETKRRIISDLTRKKAEAVYEGKSRMVCKGGALCEAKLMTVGRAKADKLLGYEKEGK